MIASFSDDEDEDWDYNSYVSGGANGSSNAGSIGGDPAVSGGSDDDDSDYDDYDDGDYDDDDYDDDDYDYDD